MEPDKFEKYMKSKLDAREIAPSQEAWQHISKELDTGLRSKRPAYFWMGIAASVLVLIGISVLYLNSGEKRVTTSPELVGSPAKVPMTNKTEKAAVDIPVNRFDGLVLEETLESKEELKDPGIISKSTPIKLGLEEKLQDAIVMEPNRQELKEVDNSIQLSDNLLNAKIAEVVAQVALLEQAAQLTDSEVDSLLLIAQQDILRQRIFNGDKTVDAMALLTEVEDELDQSFRDQIFQSLKTGFLKVKTAVADRNN